MPSFLCAAVTAIVAGIISIFAVVETGLVPVSSFRFFNPTPMPSKAVMGPVTLQDVDDVVASIDRLESLVAKLTMERLQEEEQEPYWPPAHVWSPIMVHDTPKPSASTTTEHPPFVWVVEPGSVDYFVWFLHNLAMGLVLVLSELCQLINRWIIENPPVAPRPKVVIKPKDLPSEAELLEQLSSGVRFPQNSDTTTLSPPSSPTPSPPSSPPPPSSPASPPSNPPSPQVRRRTTSAPPTVSFSLPVPPKPVPAAPSGAFSRLRPEAAPFVPTKDPRAQNWPSTMTPTEMKAKYHRHGTKAAGY